MSRIEALNQRYAASAALVRHGVEVVAIGDPRGARLNAAARRLLQIAKDDGLGLWDSLVDAVKTLRWRLLTQPQPIELNEALQDGARGVVTEAGRLRGAVASENLLEELAAAAAGVTETDPLIGDVLLRSIEEVGRHDCVVIAASKSAQAGLQTWLDELGIPVLTAGELERDQPKVEQAYVVGPPRFLRSSLVTAPVTSAVSFLIPAWFGDRQVPRSAIAPYADGAIRIEARVFTEGDVSGPETEAAATAVEDEFLPEPRWGERRSPEREPTSEEVLAWKVLLSGRFAIWLDDGDRIRALDPDQPTGERVIYSDVDAVRPETYLLLRQGETERGALYAAALSLVGALAPAVDGTQRAWKEQLSRRLVQQGYAAVVRDLRSRGVKTADRARAWTEPNLVRPNSDHDFEALLQWLGIPIQPTFGYATMLRRLLYQASADIREQLEDAVSAADLSELERTGHLSLDVQTEGFRGIIATRVLAISPHQEIIPRHDARVPFPDGGAQWLE